MMKTLKLLPLLALLLLSACDKNAEVKKFIMELNTAVVEDNAEAINKMYPNAASADALALGFDADSVDIEKIDDGTWKVSIGDGKELTVAKDAEGVLSVTESRGVFVWPDDKMDFARKTGWINDDMSDAKIATQFADTAFVTYMENEIAKRANESLVILNPSDWMKCVSPLGRDNYEHPNYGKHTCSITVENKTDMEIPESAFSVSCSIYEYAKAGGSSPSELVSTSTKKLEGKTIPPHGKQTFSTSAVHDYFGGSGYAGLKYKAKLKIDVNHPVFKDYYQFTGNEYEEYCKQVSSGN